MISPRPRLPPSGYLPNDLVFIADGGFYFKAFRGISTDPAGGVYYVSPYFQRIVPLLPHVSEANGIVLSPDGRRLWTPEFGKNHHHPVDLERLTQIASIGHKRFLITSPLRGDVPTEPRPGL